jgi:purine-nucleoside phosphorylase
MTPTFDMMREAQEAIAKRCAAADPAPAIGIILGTGLNRLANEIRDTVAIPYEEIPHFPLSTVEHHAGRLILGMLAGRSVVAMQGRFHLYEGYTMQQIVFPVRVMKLMGVKTLVVSNACGGLNPLFGTGSIMAITDHINLLPGNPLIGPNDPRIGKRFPDMSAPYSERLLDLLSKVALEKGIRVERGVYAAMTGPSLETRAEYRMLRAMGADAIGMSTVPEVIAAVHAGMEVLGLSVITDSCLPDALEPTDLDTIIATANRVEPSLVTLIRTIVPQL